MTKSLRTQGVLGSPRFWLLWAAATFVPWAVGHGSLALASLLALVLLGLFGLALILELLSFLRSTATVSLRVRHLRLLMLALCAGAALVVSYLGVFAKLGVSLNERQRTALIRQLEKRVDPRDLIGFAQSLTQMEGLGRGRITNRLAYRDTRLTGLKETFGYLPDVYYFSDSENRSNVVVHLAYPGGVTYQSIVVVLGNPSDARLREYQPLTRWTNGVYVSAK